MYSLELRENVDRIFSKLAKKSPNKMRIIEKKIKQICEKPSYVNKWDHDAIVSFLSKSLS